MCIRDRYKGRDYTDSSPWEYYSRTKDYIVIHPRTKALLEHLLLMLKEQGEERTFAYIRKMLKRKDY